MPEAVVTRGTMEAYTISVGHEYAQIAVRGWTRSSDDGGFGGEVLIHSSFGSWGNTWGNTGQSIKEFLIDCDFSYIFEKFMGSELRVWSAEKSMQALKEAVLEMRREYRIEKESARQFWMRLDVESEAMEGGEQGFVRGVYECIEAVDHARDLYRLRDRLNEPWELFCRDYDEQAAGFWRVIWPHFVAAVQAEK